VRLAVQVLLGAAALADHSSQPGSTDGVERVE
jgi:hypothetical protein